MDATTKEFYVHQEFLDALMENGRQRLVEWFPVENHSSEVEDRIGIHIGFDTAEEILLKYRKSGVDPAMVSGILSDGAMYL